MWGCLCSTGHTHTLTHMHTNAHIRMHHRLIQQFDNGTHSPPPIFCKELKELGVMVNLHSPAPFISDLSVSLSGLGFSVLLFFPLLSLCGKTFWQKVLKGKKINRKKHFKTKFRRVETDCHKKLWEKVYKKCLHHWGVLLYSTVLYCTLLCFNLVSSTTR